jgi:hypothetical protein
MDVEALIEAYVEDVKQLLPRKQREDVAFELRQLVREELQARAASLGRPLDADIALEGLRAFGKPQDVAARYCEPLIIIPQTETRKFALAAIVGALVLIALSPLGTGPSLGDQVVLAILAWLGALVTFFGLRSLIQRNNVAQPWAPRDRDRTSRAGSIALVALICVGILAYAAPSWLFAQFTHGATLPASLELDPVFRSSRLPALFALWGCQAVLFAVLTVRGRWNPLLRRVDAGLESGIVAVLVWFVAAGSVFKEATPNKGALSWISAFALIMLVDLGVKLYRGLGPMSPPSDRLEASSLGVTRP